MCLMVRSRKKKGGYRQQQLLFCFVKILINSLLTRMFTTKKLNVENFHNPQNATMKKLNLMLLLCAVATLFYGQVKVQDGSLMISNSTTISPNKAFVYIDKTSVTNYTQYGIYSNINQKGGAPDGDCIGIYGRAYNPLASGYPARYVGVMGYTYNLNTNLKYGIGVAGLAGTSGGHIGVYGGVSSIPSSLPNAIYAGYFSGNVYVNGNLSATTLTQSSDKRLKQNILSLKNNVVSNLIQLNPVLYNLKQIEKQDTLLDTRGGDSIAIVKRYNENSQEFKKTHYGFLAQELQKIYPDLVYEGGDGYLEINYIGLIPLLVSSIQELNDKIYTLEKELNSEKSSIMRNNAPSKTLQEKDVTNESVAILFQNSPNPFSDKTEITYYLPQNIQSAFLYIYDMNGNQLKQITLTQKGNASIIINSRQFGAGMYLYSLIADNQLIDTKRMILTK